MTEVVRKLMMENWYRADIKENRTREGSKDLWRSVEEQNTSLLIRIDQSGSEKEKICQ